MEQQNDKATVFFMVAVMAFAMVLVDDRWVRVGLGLLPALLLAQRALLGAGIGATEEYLVGAAAEAQRAGGATEDRRGDDAVRGYIDELLKHIREFYTTCHLMAGGQMEPEEAKNVAAGVERQLNRLLAEISDEAQERAEGGSK